MDSVSYRLLIEPDEIERVERGEEVFFETLQGEYYGNTLLCIGIYLPTLGLNSFVGKFKDGIFNKYFPGPENILSLIEGKVIENPLKPIRSEIIDKEELNFWDDELAEMIRKWNL